MCRCTLDTLCSDCIIAADRERKRLAEAYIKKQADELKEELDKMEER